MFYTLTQSPNPQIPGLLVHNEWRGTYEEFEEAVELGDLQSFLRIEPSRRTTKPTETNPQAPPRMESLSNIPPGPAVNPSPAAPGQGRRTLEDEDVLSFLPQGTTVTDAEVDALLKELEKPLPRTARRTYVPSNRLGNVPLPLPTMPTPGVPQASEHAKYDPQSRNLVSEAAKAIGVEVKPRGPPPRMKLNHRPLHEIMAERRERMARTENDRRNDELFSSLGLSDKTISVEEADAFLRAGTIPDLKASHQGNSIVPSSQPQSLLKDISTESGEDVSVSQPSQEAPNVPLLDAKNKSISKEVLYNEVDKTSQHDDEYTGDILANNQDAEEQVEITEPTEPYEDEKSATKLAEEEVDQSQPEQSTRQAEGQEMTQLDEPVSENDASEAHDKNAPTSEGPSVNHEGSQSERASAELSQKDEEDNSMAITGAPTEAADTEPVSNESTDDISGGVITIPKDPDDHTTDGITSSESILENQSIDGKDLGVVNDDAQKEVDDAETESVMPITQDTNPTDPVNDIKSSDATRSCSPKYEFEEKDDAASELSVTESVSKINQGILGAKDESPAGAHGEPNTNEETFTSDMETGNIPATTLERHEDQDDENDPETADVLEPKEQNLNTPSAHANQTNASCDLQDVKPEDKNLGEPNDDRVLASNHENTTLVSLPPSSSQCEPADNGPISTNHDVLCEEFETEDKDVRFPVDHADTNIQETEEKSAVSQKETQPDQISGLRSSAIMKQDSQESALLTGAQDTLSEKANEPREGGNAVANLEEQSHAHANVDGQETTPANTAHDQEDVPAGEDRDLPTQNDVKPLQETEGMPISPCSIPQMESGHSQEDIAEPPLEKGTEYQASAMEDTKSNDPGLDDVQTTEASEGKEDDTTALGKTEDVSQPTNSLPSAHDKENISHKVQDEAQDMIEEAGYGSPEKSILPPAQVSNIAEETSGGIERPRDHVDTSNPADSVLSVNGQNPDEEVSLEKPLLAANPETTEISDTRTSATEEQKSNEVSHDDTGDDTIVIHPTVDHDAELGSQTFAAAGSGSAAAEVADKSTLEHPNPSSLPESSPSDVQDQELPHSSDRTNKPDVGAQNTVDVHKMAGLPGHSENSQAISNTTMSLDTDLAQNATMDPSDSRSVYSNEESAPSSREPWTEGAGRHGTEATDASTRQPVDESLSTVSESSMPKQDSNKDLDKPEIPEDQTKKTLLPEIPSTSQEDMDALQDAVEPLPMSNEVRDPLEPKATAPSSLTHALGRRVVTAVPAAESRPEDSKVASSARTVSQPVKSPGHRRTISDILREADEIIQASKE